MAAIKKAAEDAGKLFGRLDAQLDGRNYVAGQHFTMGDIPVGCFVHRWYALDIERPELKNLRGLVRPAGDAPGLRQARHGEADLTAAGVRSVGRQQTVDQLAEPGRAGVEAGRQHAARRARGRSASAAPR